MKNYARNIEKMILRCTQENKNYVYNLVFRYKLRGGIGKLCILWPFYKASWVFPKIEVPQNGWFIMENPIF